MSQMLWILPSEHFDELEIITKRQIISRARSGNYTIDWATDSDQFDAVTFSNLQGTNFMFVFKIVKVSNGWITCEYQYCVN